MKSLPKIVFCLICLLTERVLHSGCDVASHFLQNPHSLDRRIEYFVARPKGEGPFPILFLLHGHQPPEKSDGGKQLVDLGYLEKFVNEGIVAVAISILGFGHSEGERDFCGPDSQQAVIALIEYFKGLPFVDGSKMGIYGISKGATLASMVSSLYPELSVQILESGWYDLVSCRALMPKYLSTILENISKEAGDSEEALMARSPIFHTENIWANTLILHGEFEDRRGLPSAQVFHEKLLEKGVESHLKIYPNALHILPVEKWETIIPYLRAQFYGLYGLGIKVAPPIPALQIEKIYEGYAAAMSGKLKVGDVILRVSPNDDENEMDVLRMPLPQFITLLLGKKGSRIRLHVQHFDQSFENITLMR